MSEPHFIHQVSSTFSKRFSKEEIERELISRANYDAKFYGFTITDCKLSTEIWAEYPELGATIAKLEVYGVWDSIEGKTVEELYEDKFNGRT